MLNFNFESYRYADPTKIVRFRLACFPTLSGNSSRSSCCDSVLQADSYLMRGDGTVSEVNR